jgi:hypothetical protein
MLINVLGYYGWIIGTIGIIMIHIIFDLNGYGFKVDIQKWPKLRVGGQSYFWS